MRNLLIIVGFVLLALLVMGGSASLATTGGDMGLPGKIVETYQENTGSTEYNYEYDLAPEVFRSIRVATDTVVEPVIIVPENGTPALYMVATRVAKDKWFFLDHALLVIGTGNGEKMRIHFGCEQLDDDIVYAKELREVLDNATVVEMVWVQLTPSPFGEPELGAIRNASTMKLVLYGKSLPAVLESDTKGEVFFDPYAWKKMVAKYDELRKKKGV